MAGFVVYSCYSGVSVIVLHRMDDMLKYEIMMIIMSISVLLIEKKKTHLK